MKKNGFTLIELLAVVVLLGILGLIATTAVNETIKKNQTTAYNTQIDNIIKGAKDWSNKHVFELPDKEGEFVIVTLGQIQNEGFAKAEIRNPKNGQLFDQNMEIKITFKNNNYEYQIVE